MIDAVAAVIGPGDEAKAIIARLAEEGLAATHQPLLDETGPFPDYALLLSATEESAGPVSVAARAGARVTARLAADDPLATAALYNAGADTVFPPATRDGHLVQHVLARLGRRPGGLQRVGPATIDVEGRALLGDGEPVALTEAEARILDLLARASGGYVSRDRISRDVFHIPYDKFDRRLDVHISNIRRKIGLAALPLVLETARKTGFRLIAAGQMGDGTAEGTD